MRSFVIEINTVVPGTDKRCDVFLDGKNMIITGVNGSGKTQLIRHLHSYCQRAIDEHHVSIESIELETKNLEDWLKANSTTHPHRDIYENKVKENYDRIEIFKRPSARIGSISRYAEDCKAGKAVLKFFEATRQANIRSSAAVTTIEQIKGQSKGVDGAHLFEDYLVSRITMQAYAESPLIGNDPLAAKNAAEWFKKLEGDLRNLFEDDSIGVIFDYKQQCFFIHQAQRAPFRFQNLSSGFSSVLAIYASLMMDVELQEVPPSEIYGIVFIDEVDAHLHVSLQRKILSFLTESFPRIQFITTTHSPFVVSSVSNALIYDLSTSQVVEDLSLYSYDSILSGLFHTPPVSKIVTAKLDCLYEEVDSDFPNFEKIKDILNSVRDGEDTLDPTSAMYVKRAKMILKKYMGSLRNV